ncbi:hypothetical protein KGM_203837 [Danaus plexippus plexippus]|uniref:Uncharacterized protein n=1 Tax=Danaus plexippus plexippus TaxID=278856 RepID=A0A212ESS4_DANPL|nr:hypothetical protein KGM_203837 [Danaus plexippus plexippus]
MASVSDSPLTRTRNRPVLSRYKPLNGSTEQSVSRVAIILGFSGVVVGRRCRECGAPWLAVLRPRAPTVSTQRAVKPPPTGTRLERFHISHKLETYCY